MTQSKKFGALRESQRNYFRRDQGSKALLATQQMRQSGTSLKSLNSPVKAPSIPDQNQEKDGAAELSKLQKQNILSEHSSTVADCNPDETVDGIHGSETVKDIDNIDRAEEEEQKDEVELEGSTEDIEGDVQDVQWQDVQVKTDDVTGSQELVIENLENLQDTSSLIVTRDGNRFKIGISAQGAKPQASNIKIDTAAADEATLDKQSRVADSQSVLERVSTQHSAQQQTQKIKVRGKVSSRGTKQHQVGILPLLSVSAAT